MNAPLSPQPEPVTGLTDYHRCCLDKRIDECNEGLALAVRALGEAENWEPFDASLRTLHDLLSAAQELTELARTACRDALQSPSDQQEDAVAMRIDKQGHLLRIGDLVRLPSGQEGCIQGFAQSGNRERVIVRYENLELGEVALLPHLLERLSWNTFARRKERRAQVRRPAGYPSGEAHCRARLTDEEVKQMRTLHRRTGMGYQSLAGMFHCGVSTARDICTLRTRRNA